MADSERLKSRILPFAARTVTEIPIYPSSWRLLMAPKLVGERTIKSGEQKALSKARQQTPTPQSSDPGTIEGVTGVSYDRFPGKLDELPILAAEYLALNQQVAEAEARKREIREEIEGFHADTEELCIFGDFFKSEVVFSHKARKLSATKLVEAGVNVDVVNECYEGGEEFSYIKISAIGGE